MTVAERQKRLNQEIARELDTYQVMLEYGRMFLDTDKEIRKSYKWITLAKAGCLSGAAIDIAVSVITAISSSEIFTRYLPVMLVVLALAIIIYVAILYKNRNKISQLIEDDERDEYKKLMDELQDYLHKLGEWLKDVDCHIQQNSTVIGNIEKDLAVAKSKQANDVNKISNIQGKLDNELDAEARKLAELRLRQLKIFIYDNV